MWISLTLEAPAARRSWAVGGAKVDQAGGNLANAAAGADRLVVDLDAGCAPLYSLNHLE
jgi:hypothetical protein